MQDVVDFLLGYQSYLVQQGFVFDDYEGNEKVVLDFEHSTREFVFWTTQNWDAGSVITLSPSALRLTFNSEYSTVDDVFDNFYGYSIVKADGKKLFEDFTTLGRSEQNKFTLSPKNTEDGIFAIRLPLVQKEHVCLIDNTTVFGDVIYDLEPGYRQERIKVLGYKTEGWDGSLNVPGFIFDDVKITEWEPYVDYQIGSVVQYKEFFYSANKKIPGVETFNDVDWVRLDSKPESGLISNFEYKTNQFADFYDLDSDNFDVEQQKLAQHLIGYQKRQYLENIINDSVSQYKFYQGYILDKGSKNSLTKLFDALASDDKDSLEFYEEWAIKDGQYGASEGFDEVEYLLDEKQFRLKPQPVELVNQIDPESKDLVYRILPYETYLKPDGYNHAPFPTKYIEKSFTGNSGYVNLEDVDHRLGFYDDITTLNFADVDSGHYVWIGNDKLTWNIYKHVDSKVDFNKIEQGDNEFTIYCRTTPNFSAGDIIGLHSVYTYEIGEGTADDSTTNTVTENVPIEKFYKIKKLVR